MKAYKAWDSKAVEDYITVVFAEMAIEAMAIAFTMPKLDELRGDANTGGEQNV